MLICHESTVGDNDLGGPLSFVSNSGRVVRLTAPDVINFLSLVSGQSVHLSVRSDRHNAMVDSCNGQWLNRTALGCHLHNLCLTVT